MVFECVCICCRKCRVEVVGKTVAIVSSILQVKLISERLSGIVSSSSEKKRFQYLLDRLHWVLLNHTFDLFVENSQKSFVVQFDDRLNFNIESFLCKSKCLSNKLTLK